MTGEVFDSIWGSDPTTAKADMSEIKGYFTTSWPSEVISAMDSAKHKSKTDAKDDCAKQGGPESRYGNEENSHTSDREKQPDEATPNRDLVHRYARMGAGQSS